MLQTVFPEQVLRAGRVMFFILKKFLWKKGVLQDCDSEIGLCDAGGVMGRGDPAN